MSLEPGPLESQSDDDEETSLAGRNMNPDLRVKLIKKKKSRVPRIPPLVQSSAVENKWSTAIQSWVSEFQKASRRIAARLQQSV